MNLFKLKFKVQSFQLEVAGDSENERVTDIYAK